MSEGLIPIFDGHNDMLLRLEGGGTFLEGDERGHLDLPRARAGGLVGGFCAVFVRSSGFDSGSFLTPTAESGEVLFPPTPSTAEAQAGAMRAMARLFHLEEDGAGAVRVVRSAAEIEACRRDGAFAALLHLEGAEAIDEELDALQVFYRAGLRSLGPVWSRPNSFGHGVPFRFGASPDTGPGLTALGRRVVEECNRLRIVLDLSHLTEAGFWDVARLSKTPLIATHSNAHARSASTRNLTDRQLDAIRDSDGMVGLNFCVGFLRADGRNEPDTPLDVVVEQIDYLVERLGIERVGFGSDFDGAVIPRAIGDAAGLPNLIDALRRRGYTDRELNRLGYENWLRVLRLTWGG